MAPFSFCEEIMIQYMKHKDHGTHIVYEINDIKLHEKSGWLCIDEPGTVKTSEYADMDINKLKKVAKEKGIIVHHEARKDSIIKNLSEAS